jgi:ABC-type nitrate/sulfonate/bicarbonate transport system substrate-binding protein
MKIKAQLSLLFVFFCCLFAPISAGAQTTSIRIAFNGFGGMTPFYLGQDVGIFKKQGLTLEMIFIPGGSLSLQALIGRSLDLLMTGGPPVVNAYLQGARIKIIAGMTNLLPYTFVVTGGVRSPEQLKGKKIGISRFGSNTDYVVRLALNQFALSPNEVQIIQVGGSQARLVRYEVQRDPCDRTEPRRSLGRVVLDAAAKENPKAKGLKVQQLVDLRYIP